MPSPNNNFGRFSNFSFSGIKNNPLTHSAFVADNSQGVIAPGSPEFISTEDSIIITTEDGIGLTTE